MYEQNVRLYPKQTRKVISAKLYITLLLYIEKKSGAREHFLRCIKKEEGIDIGVYKMLVI